MSQLISCFAFSGELKKRAANAIMRQAYHRLFTEIPQYLSFSDPDLASLTNLDSYTQSTGQDLPYSQVVRSLNHYVLWWEITKQVLFTYLEQNLSTKASALVPNDSVAVAFKSTSITPTTSTESSIAKATSPSELILETKLSQLDLRDWGLEQQWILVADTNCVLASNWLEQVDRILAQLDDQTTVVLLNNETNDFVQTASAELQAQAPVTVHLGKLVADLYDIYQPELTAEQVSNYQQINACNQDLNLIALAHIPTHHTAQTYLVRLDQVVSQTLTQLKDPSLTLQDLWQDFIGLKTNLQHLDPSLTSLDYPYLETLGSLTIAKDSQVEIFSVETVENITRPCSDLTLTLSQKVKTSYNYQSAYLHLRAIDKCYTDLNAEQVYNQAHIYAGSYNTPTVNVDKVLKSEHKAQQLKEQYQKAHQKAHQDATPDTNLDSIDFNLDANSVKHTLNHNIDFNEYTVQSYLNQYYQLLDNIRHLLPLSDNFIEFRALRTYQAQRVLTCYPSLSVASYVNEQLLDADTFRTLHWQRHWQLGNSHPTLSHISITHGVAFNSDQTLTNSISTLTDVSALTNSALTTTNLDQKIVTYGYDYLSHAYKFVLVADNMVTDLSQFYTNAHTTNFVPIVLTSPSASANQPLANLLSCQRFAKANVLQKQHKSDLNHMINFLKVCNALVSDNQVKDTDLVVLVDADVKLRADWYEQLNLNLDYLNLAVCSQQMLLGEIDNNLTEFKFNSESDNNKLGIKYSSTVYSGNFKTLDASDLVPMFSALSNFSNVKSKFLVFRKELVYRIIDELKDLLYGFRFTTLVEPLSTSSFLETPSLFTETALSELPALNQGTLLGLGIYNYNFSYKTTGAVVNNDIVPLNSVTTNYSENSSKNSNITASTNSHKKLSKKAKAQHQQLNQHTPVAAISLTKETSAINVISTSQPEQVSASLCLNSEQLTTNPITCLTRKPYRLELDSNSHHLDDYIFASSYAQNFNLTGADSEIDLDQLVSATDLESFASLFDSEEFAQYLASQYHPYLVPYLLAGLQQGKDVFSQQQFKNQLLDLYDNLDDFGLTFNEYVVDMCQNSKKNTHYRHLVPINLHRKVVAGCGQHQLGVDFSVQESRHLLFTLEHYLVQMGINKRLDSVFTHVEHLGQLIPIDQISNQQILGLGIALGQWLYSSLCMYYGFTYDSTYLCNPPLALNSFKSNLEQTNNYNAKLFNNSLVQHTRLSRQLQRYHNLQQHNPQIIVDHMAKVRKFVINLPESVERLVKFRSQPHGNEFTVVEAVDGRKLSTEVLTASFDLEKAYQYYQRILSRGEVGCTLSHVQIYEQVLMDTTIGDDDWVLVCEDDTIFIDNWYERTNQILDYISNHTSQKPSFIQCAHGEFAKGKEHELKLLQASSYFDVHNEDSYSVSDQQSIFFPFRTNTYYSSHYMFQKRELKRHFYRRHQRPYWLADDFPHFFQFKPDSYCFPNPMLSYQDEVVSIISEERQVQRNKIRLKLFTKPLLLQKQLTNYVMRRHTIVIQRKLTLEQIAQKFPYASIVIEREPLEQLSDTELYQLVDLPTLELKYGSQRVTRDRIIRSLQHQRAYQHMRNSFDGNYYYYLIMEDTVEPTASNPLDLVNLLVGYITSRFSTITYLVRLENQFYSYELAQVNYNPQQLITQFQQAGYTLPDLSDSDISEQINALGYNFTQYFIPPEKYEDYLEFPVELSQLTGDNEERFVVDYSLAKALPDYLVVRPYLAGKTNYCINKYLEFHILGQIDDSGPKAYLLFSFITRHQARITSKLTWLYGNFSDCFPFYTGSFASVNPPFFYDRDVA